MRLPRTIRRLTTLAALAAAASAGLALSPAVTTAAPVSNADRSTWVGGWTAAPTDALNGADANLTPILNIADQTFRVILTPHATGTQVRVRLTNRERPAPLTIGAATVAYAGAGAAITNPVSLTFQGRHSVTIPAGADVLSDPVPLSVRAWRKLAVSVSVRGPAVFVTQHLNGNATSYYTAPGAGDRTRSTGAASFPLSTTVVPIVNRVDVAAASGTRTIVTLGDSITDGYIADNYLGFPQSRGAVDTNVRYPDFLQHRIDTAGRPLSVVNAGISGNRTIADGFVPLFGKSAIARLDRDVIAVPGVSDVILLEGINDLGVPIGSNPDQIISGYKNIITRLHARGIRVHLGTILPASNAILDGYSAPLANSARLVINRWIRGQHLADSVVDFDRAIRDKRNPNISNPRYIGVDNLHPSPAGYRKMADTVNLDQLAR